MPSLIQKDKSTSEKCGTITTRNNSVRHKKRISAGSLTCPSCTKFSAKSSEEKKYHVAKKHLKATVRVVYECKIREKAIHSFYYFREHQRREHGAQRRSGAQNVDVTQLMRDVDDNSLKEELETSKRFLVDDEMENWRQRNYNIAIDTLDPKYLLEKLDVVFDSLKCAAKPKGSIRLCAQKVEDTECWYITHTKGIHFCDDLNLWLLQKIRPKTRTY